MKKVLSILAVLLCVTAVAVSAQENTQPLIEIGLPVLLTYEFPLTVINDPNYEDLTSEALNRLRFGINAHIVFNVTQGLAIGVESGASIGFTEPEYQNLIQDVAVDVLINDQAVNTEDLIAEFISIDVPFHLLIGINLTDGVTVDAFGGVVFRDVDSLDFTYFAGEIGARLNLLGLLIELGYIFPAELSNAEKSFLDYTSNVFRIGVGIQGGR